MDWSRFNTHGDSPTRAFEAFTGCLFERWCRKEYGDSIEHVYFVNGAGGDGGVEVYAVLRNGRVVGLQAKWFREPLNPSRLSQIKKSFETATKVRPNITHYVVALPRGLADQKLGKRGKPVESTERGIWEYFAAQSEASHPNTKLELWDESRIEQLLAELGTDGLSRYWFSQTVIHLSSLKMSFDRQKRGWLSHRYFPDLHKTGQIGADLSVRLAGPASVTAWQTEVSRLITLLEQAKNEVGRIRQGFPAVMAVEGLEECVLGAMASIEDASDEVQALASALLPGSSFPYPTIVAQDNELIGIRNLLWRLQSLAPNNTELRPTKSIEEVLSNLVYQWDDRKITPETLENYSLTPMYIAQAGAGKTHALANEVEAQLKNDVPALLIRAMEQTPRDGWDPIIRKAVAEANWNLSEIFDALESSAAQADVRRAALLQAGDTAPRSRVLIAIDGLDETPRPISWSNLLGELASFTKIYPRLLFAVSVRPSLESRLPRLGSLDHVAIRGSDPDISEVFLGYCAASHISAPPTLRWALREPLAVRLFAELYRGGTITEAFWDDLSLVNLLEGVSKVMALPICVSSIES